MRVWFTDWRREENEEEGPWDGDGIGTRRSE